MQKEESSQPLPLVLTFILVLSFIHFIFSYESSERLFACIKPCADPVGLKATIKWKYHVLLTGIQIENHFNLLISVCINSWSNTAYVTNPQNDCAEISACLSTCLLFNPHQRHFIPLQNSMCGVCKKKDEKKIQFLFIINMNSTL